MLDMHETLRGVAREAVRAALARSIDRARSRTSRRLARPRSRSAGRPTPSTATSRRTWRCGSREPLRMAPPAIAAALAEALHPGRRRAGSDDVVASAEAAGPGFLNLRFADAAIEALLDAARARARRLGPRRRRRRGTDGRHVNVEFVSANPTGPLTVGNARGAFVGDLLARVLEAGGQRVTREYYFNDSGAQVQNLGASILAIREGRRDPRGRLPRRVRGRSRSRAPRRARRRPPRRGDEPTRRRRRPLGLGPDPRRASRPRSTRSASASTSGRPRRASTTTAGSTGRSTGCATAATCTSRTARRGSGRPRSATTRTASSSARTARRRTSRPTSAT